MAELLITALKDFPAIEELLQSPSLAPFIETIPRPIITEVVREEVGRLKEQFQKDTRPFATSEIIASVERALLALERRRLTRVINATGVIVHTNLGRAPLSKELVAEITGVVSGYSNLEFDLSTGRRGNRGEAAEEYLALLSGAESATVVNNCAAALYLMINTLANRKEVIISRGELVQIGGGFRIPDILVRAGAKLNEIGTTNITSLGDYQSAISDRTGMILKVHQSNFVQAGFTDEVSLKELSELGRVHDIPVINDLGSGVFVSTKELIGYEEPTVQQSVRSGADLTSFSGDKMLGGVQAGLVVGKANLIAQLKKNPMFRAVRADKIAFAVLERLLASYLRGTASTDIQLWKILATPPSEIYRYAKGMVGETGNPAGVSVEATQAQLGGGALPETNIPSVGIIFNASNKASTLLKLFRDLPTPIIGRVETDRFIIDLKAVDRADYPLIVTSMREVLALVKAP